MTALAVGGQLLGTIAGMAGARTQGAAARLQGDINAYNYMAQREAFDFNAEVAKQEARNEQDVALGKAKDFRRAGSAALAGRRAKLAASGVDMSGSPLLADEAILSEIEFGAQRIINAGDIVSTRKKNEATLLKAQARNARVNARLASKAGNLGATAASIGTYSAIAQGAADIGSTLATAGVSFG